MSERFTRREFLKAGLLAAGAATAGALIEGQNKDNRAGADEAARLSHGLKPYEESLNTGTAYRRSEVALPVGIYDELVHFERRVFIDETRILERNSNDQPIFDGERLLGEGITFIPERVVNMSPDGQVLVIDGSLGPRKDSNTTVNTLPKLVALDERDTKQRILFRRPNDDTKPPFNSPLVAILPPGTLPVFDDTFIIMIGPEGVGTYSYNGEEAWDISVLQKLHDPRVSGFTGLYDKEDPRVSWRKLFIFKGFPYERWQDYVMNNFAIGTDEGIKLPEITNGREYTLTDFNFQNPSRALYMRSSNAHKDVIAVEYTRIENFTAKPFRQEEQDALVTRRHRKVVVMNSINNPRNLAMIGPESFKGGQFTEGIDHVVLVGAAKEVLVVARVGEGDRVKAIGIVNNKGELVAEGTVSDVSNPDEEVDLYADVDQETLEIKLPIILTEAGLTVDQYTLDLKDLQNLGEGRIHTVQTVDGGMWKFTEPYKP